MNKRILHIIVALFLSMSGVFAQTVQLETVVDAVPGTVSVDLNMNGFTGANGGIGAVTLNIDYDPTVLLGIPTLTNKAFSNITRNVSNGHLIITWFWTDVESPYPDINGLFVTLNFDYPGGFATDLVFNEPLCEVTQGTTPITPMYVDGSVSNSLDMDTYTGTAYLMSGYADVGETISWPLATMGNLAITGAFQTINSFTFHLSYDPTKLTYQSLTPNPSFTGVAVSGGNGLIHVGWSGATAQDLSDKLLGLLNFTYIGGGAATLSFEPGSIITSGTTIQNTYFVGGTVDVFPTGPFDGSITISQVGSTMGTANVDVPVVASGLSDNPAGAINFKMTFDPAELTYKGYTANQFAGWVVSQSPAGTLNFIKTSITPLTIADGPLVTLKFDYLINTQADITFMGGTSIQSPSFAYIPTDYVDGFISTKYTLTATAGAHGTLAAAYTGEYFLGTVVPIEGVANTGYKFLNWTGTGAANIADVMDATTTVTIPASDIAIQANFEVDPAQTFALTLTLGANGSAVTGDGSYNVEHVQAITATAATGYRFTEWTGTGLAYVTDPADATTTVTMPAAAIGLTANFEVDPAQTFALTLTLGANGSAVAGGGSYNVEHVQAITATAATGYRFTEWTGTGLAYVTDPADATTTVTMPAAAIGLTANFEVDPAQTFALTLTLGANGSAVTGDGSYNVEHVQAITATAATGYRFLNWTGTGSAYVTSLTSASTNVTMPALAIGLTANFEPDPAQTFALTLTLGANGSAVTGDGSYTVGHVQAITATPLTGYHFVNWTGTGAAYVADVNDPTTTVTMPAMAIGLTANFAGHSVSGTVKYANTTGPVRPITNSRVYLKTSDGLTVLQTTTSDASGNFTFSDVADGSYKLVADTDKAWGGLNAIDFVVLKSHLNGVTILTGLKWIAADITNDNLVNAIDGVRMKNRISSGSTVGWNRPNWNFQQESVTVSGANASMDIIGICTGDVNASYNTIPL